MATKLRENIQNKKMVAELQKQNAAAAQTKKEGLEDKTIKATNNTNAAPIQSQMTMKAGGGIGNPIAELFEDQLHTDLFNARCHDTGETTNIENAKLFKEDLLRRNVKNSSTLNLQSLRLGINAIIALSNALQTRKFEKLNLADNAISDYGMHAIKNIINNSGVRSLNLASNMISGEGLELFLDDLIANTQLKHLDIGVVEGSMRKNSLGIQGAVCIAAMLIRNRTIESLSINDNDLGADGGECVGIALS